MSNLSRSSKIIQIRKPILVLLEPQIPVESFIPHEFVVHVSLQDSFEYPNWPGTQSTILPTFGAIIENDSFEYSDWPGTQSTLVPVFGAMLENDSFEVTDGWS